MDTNMNTSNEMKKGEKQTKYDLTTLNSIIKDKDDER